MSKIAKTRLVSLLFMLVLSVLMTSCAKRQHITDRHYYRLQPDSHWVNPAPAQRPVPVYIPRAQALGVVGSRPMLVRTGDGSLVQMHHHFWLDSPRVMWQNIMLDWATRSRIWPQVRDIKPVHPHHDTLQLTILALEKDQAQVRISLRATLLDEHKNQRYQATFDKQEALSVNTIGAFVDAVNDMSGAILRELDTDIRAVLFEPTTKAEEQND